jgi:hypothetical protein
MISSSFEYVQALKRKYDVNKWIDKESQQRNANTHTGGN